MQIAPRAKMEEWRRKKAAAAVKMKGVEGLTGHPAIYIPGIYYPEYSAPGPEYPDRSEFPGPGPETPAPPQTKQIWHVQDSIYMDWT